VHYNLGRLAEDRAEPEEAARRYQAALEANPRDFLSLMSLGTLAGRRGDPGAAVGFYRRALELAPGMPAAERLRRRLAEPRNGGNGKSEQR